MPTSTSEIIQPTGIVTYKGTGQTAPGDIPVGAQPETPISGTYTPFPVKPIESPVTVAAPAQQEATQLQTDIQKAQTAPPVISPDLTRIQDLGKQQESLLGTRRTQLEQRRLSETERINQEYAASQEKLRQSQEKAAGRGASTIARMGGYLGPSGSGEAFMQNLEQAHRAEQRDMELKRQTALAQAEQAFQDGDYKLAQLQLDTAKQTEKDIYQREQDFAEQQSKARNQQMKEAQFEFDMEKTISDITQTFRGEPTFEAKKQQFQEAIQRANLTEMFEGETTAAGKQRLFDQAMAKWDQDLDSELKNIAIQKGNLEIQEMIDEFYGAEVATPDDLSPLAKAVYNGTVDLKDLPAADRASIIPELDAIGFKQGMDAESKANIGTIITGLDDVMAKWSAIPNTYKGMVQGRFSELTNLEDIVPSIAEFKAAQSIVGMQITRLFEKGRISDQDRLFYLSLMPNLKQTTATATKSYEQLKINMNNLLNQQPRTTTLKPTSYQDYIQQADPIALEAIKGIRDKARNQGYSDDEIISEIEKYLINQGLIQTQKGTGGGKNPIIKFEKGKYLSSIGTITGEEGSSYWTAGLDVGGSFGKPIPAPLGGKIVSLTSESKSGGFGNRIEVELPDGNVLWISHLKDFGNYKMGDKVAKGEVLGTMGNTGNVLTLHNGKWEKPTKKELASGAGAHADITILKKGKKPSYANKGANESFFTAPQVKQYLTKYA